MSDHRTRPPQFLALLLALLTSAGAARAADPAVPERYEVKFLLKPEAVLTADHTLRPDVARAFQVKGSGVAMHMLFLDNHALALNEQKWNVRVRKLGNEPKPEITYKRRYLVQDGLDKALKQAAADGFDAGEADYKVEVEWGAKRQTLTFSLSKPLAAAPGPDGLPDGKASRKAAVDEMPGKLSRALPPAWSRTSSPTHTSSARSTGSAGRADSPMSTMPSTSRSGRSGRRTRRASSISWKCRSRRKSGTRPRRAGPRCTSCSTGRSGSRTRRSSRHS